MSYCTVASILLQVVTLVGADDVEREHSISNTSTNSSALVESLRRQLMKNNYDYLPESDNEEITVAKRTNDKNDDNEFDHKADDENPKKHSQSKVDDKAKKIFRNNIDTKFDGINDEDDDKIFPESDLNRRADEMSNARDDADSHRIAKNDLLYYMDDERLKTEATTITHRPAKIKAPHPKRSKPKRRRTRGEASDGITILTLDDDPLPAVLLHKARRQNMKNPHRRSATGI